MTNVHISNKYYNRFLYELIDMNVYVTQFEKFIKNFDLICHLLKTLYNLKQISRI